MTARRRRTHRWVPWSGVGAVVGAALWTAMPWLQLAALGTRPYVATVYDVVASVGWLLMIVGLAGVHSTFRSRYGRLGRVGVWTTAVGMGLVAAVLGRSVAAFLAAGLRAVPAIGEDPAGLVVTFVTALGLSLTVAGASVLGVALRRLDPRTSATTVLLVAGSVVPVLTVALRHLSLLPLPLGRLLVRTNLVLVPFGIGWMALGRLVWHVSRHAESSRERRRRSERTGGE